MIHEIPLHVQKSAESDIQYLLHFLNHDEDLDAELFRMDINLEDEEGERYDVSVKSVIGFGFEPRQYIHFEFDYYVDGDSIKFWNHTDISTLATELRNEIFEKRRRCLL